MTKKVVLITGTNSGFGHLTAKGAAAKGHTVYASMRNVDTKNAEKAKELSIIENIHVVEIDITNAEQVKSVVNSIIEKEGRLDILINNAGYYGLGITETFTVEDIENMYDVNVKGSWRMMKAALPQMRKQKSGLIVNISSGLGRFSSPFMTVYNSSKFALEGLAEGLHYEVRPFGIDVVIVQPGAFPTEIFNKTTYGADKQLADEYGELSKLPKQLGQGILQMFESVKPDPQMVPDAIFKLMEMDQGKRPLRTVVDAITGQFVEKANTEVKQEYDKFITAFGLEALLN